MLSLAARFSALRPVAELPHPAAAAPGRSAPAPPSIISSIDFNRDDSIFATAGVSQRIALYDCGAVLAAAAKCQSSGANGGAALQPPALSPAAARPVREIAAHSKLSCLSFSAFQRHQFLSSNYEGIVERWDAETGRCLESVDADGPESSRIWSVHWSPLEPDRYASGGDDGKLKVRCGLGLALWAGRVVCLSALRAI